MRNRKSSLQKETRGKPWNYRFHCGGQVVNNPPTPQKVLIEVNDLHKRQNAMLNLVPQPHR